MQSGTKRKSEKSGAFDAVGLGTPGRAVDRVTSRSSPKKSGATGRGAPRVTGNFTGRACTSLFDLARCLDECRDWSFPRR